MIVWLNQTKAGTATTKILSCEINLVRCIFNNNPTAIILLELYALASHPSPGTSV